LLPVLYDLDVTSIHLNRIGFYIYPKIETGVYLMRIDWILKIKCSSIGQEIQFLDLY